MRINEIKKTEYKKGDLNISLESCVRYFVAFKVETLDGKEMYLENQYILDVYERPNGSAAIEMKESGKIQVIRVKESVDTVKMLIVEADNEYETVVNEYSLQPLKEPHIKLEKINTKKYKKGEQWITLKSCAKYLVAFKVITYDDVEFYLNPEYILRTNVEEDFSTSILVEDPDYTFKLRVKESIGTVRMFIREAINNYKIMVQGYSLQSIVENQELVDNLTPRVKFVNR